MEIERQVCSLESAKKLKELGVKQESLFWWAQRKQVVIRHPPKEPTYYEPDLFMDISESGLKVIASAYTVAELLYMLPDYIKNRGNMLTLVKSDSGEWWVNYPNHGGEGLCGLPEFVDISVCEALAKCLIYLTTNGLLKGEA